MGSSSARRSFGAGPAAEEGIQGCGRGKWGARLGAGEGLQSFRAVPLEKAGSESDAQACRRAAIRLRSALRPRPLPMHRWRRRRWKSPESRPSWTSQAGQASQPEGGRRCSPKAAWPLWERRATVVVFLDLDMSLQSVRAYLAVERSDLLERAVSLCSSEYFSGGRPGWAKPRNPPRTLRA